MKKRYFTSLSQFVLCAVFIGALTGCASLSEVFDKDDEEPRLKGERISIMELQTKLEPEQDAAQSPYEIPAVWNNEFWPQQGGYPNHAMHNPALDASPMTELWNVSIGRGSTKELPLSSQPVIIDGRVYTLNTNAEIRGFAADDGRQLWDVSIANEEEGDDVIGGGIAGSRGKLYVTNGVNEVLKLDGESGDIEWRVTLPSAARAAPSVLGGRVFVQTLNNQLIALAASDGDLLWTHQAISESSGLLGAPSPAVNRDIVVPGYSSGELYALRIENGGVAWQDNLSPEQRLGGVGSLSDIRAMPVLDRGLVIAISFGGRLVAIDQRTGRRVWQREIGGSETPWVAGESVFVLSSQNRLVSFERETGNIRWVKDMPKFEGEQKDEKPLILHGPVMAGGRLIITASDSTIFEIDPVTGEETSRWKANEDLAGPAIVAGNTLYLLSDNGRLMALQ